MACALGYRLRTAKAVGRVGSYRDLREFGEQDHEQGVDLIFVAHHIIAELVL
jgi:hypothetical protein